MVVYSVENGLVAILFDPCEWILSSSGFVVDVKDLEKQKVELERLLQAKESQNKDLVAYGIQKDSELQVNCSSQ